MKNKILQIVLVIAGFIGLNLLTNRFFFRLDLTQEKRYTISDATQNLLKNLEDEVFVKVYLTGKSLPADFRRLETSVRETLDEFKIYGGKNIKYVFVDINSEIKDEKIRNQKFIEIAEKGIPPTDINFKEEGKSSRSRILPGAVITYQDRELGVLLLKGNKMSSPQEVLNQSNENVEYQLASAIKQLTIQEKKKIGFFVEYSRLPYVNQVDLITTLKKNYELYPVDLKKSDSLSGLDAIFVMKPDQKFDDSDKYKIDQFIMNGGKALFFIDAVKVDSAAREGSLCQPMSINLEDLLFKYGVRLNFNLIKDAQMCAEIPMNIGDFGNQSNIKMIPWQYFPLINNYGNSPIVRNLDAVYTKYVGTLDTVRADGIKKTPLMMTSKYTQLLKAPAVMSYNFASKDQNVDQYKAGVQTISVLLEGKFESLFNNRILPSDSRATTFKGKGKETKIIVCSDGDIPTNVFSKKYNQPLPLGFDEYSGNTFANKDFVMNAMDYLLDENGVISARNKVVKLRPLDKSALEQERGYWQGVNLVIPLILLVIGGLLQQFLRKRRYA
jgi:ABC-2 type transport system permease protein